MEHGRDWRTDNDHVNDSATCLPRPEKELKGFQKIFLLPGQKKTFSITLEQDAFSFYNDIKEHWVFEPGNFVIMLGSSSRDIRLQKTIELK